MAVAARSTTTPGAAEVTPGAPSAEPVGETRRLSTTVFLAGVLMVFAGAWGAIAPMVGPEWGFVADRTQSFTPTQQNVWLAIVPGAVALVCGLAIAGSARSTLGRMRADLWLLGFVAVLCGAWFCIGQYAWLALGGHRYLVPAGADLYLWKQLGFTVGVGAVLVLLGAMTMGWSGRKTVAPIVPGPYPRIVPTRVATGPVVAEPSTQAVPVVPAAVPTAPVAVSTPPAGVASPPVAPEGVGPVETVPVADPTVVERPPTGTVVESGTATPGPGY